MHRRKRPGKLGRTGRTNETFSNLGGNAEHARRDSPSTTTREGSRSDEEKTNGAVLERPRWDGCLPSRAGGDWASWAKTAPVTAEPLGDTASVEKQRGSAVVQGRSTGRLWLSARNRRACSDRKTKESLCCIQRKVRNPEASAGQEMWRWGYETAPLASPEMICSGSEMPTVLIAMRVRQHCESVRIAFHRLPGQSMQQKFLAGSKRCSMEPGQRGKGWGWEGSRRSRALPWNHA